MQKTSTQYVTIHFPLHDTGLSVPAQRDKLVEEYNELRKELFNEAEPDRMLHEIQDVLQAYIALMMVQARPITYNHHDAAERVRSVVEDANMEHRKKLERYKAERGWL